MTEPSTATTVHLAGTFTVDSWDQQDDDPRGPLTTATAVLTKTYGGDVTGTSRTRITLLGVTDGTRAYCGFEHLEGTVAGRTGGLVLRHAAEDGPDGPWLTWTVVPGTGTGGLTGVRGEGLITVGGGGGHTYRLELVLPDAG